MVWTRLSALIVKELLAAFRDPKARFALIIPPLIQLFLFAYAATLEVSNVPVGVINQDWGAASEQLVSRFERASAFSEIRRYDGPREAQAAIDRQDVMVVVQIGQDFSRKLASGERPQIQLLLDPNRDYKTAMVPTLIGSLTMSTVLMIVGMSIARERELGTFEQLLVSPLEPLEIVVGKAVPGLIIGLGQGILLTLIVIYVFGIALTGSVLVLFTGLIVFLLSVIGVALFISSLVANQQQAMMGIMVYMMPAMLLSVFTAPIQNMPAWLQPVALLNPLTHFLVIIRGVFLRDMPFCLVAERIWPMAATAVFTIATATWLFRRRAQ